jgi:predicted nucleic acid-binding protein
MTEGRPTDDELVQQLEEELKKLKVSDLLVQTLYTVSSLGYRRLATEERDLDQARLAIESLRALLPVLESELGEEAMRDFKQVTANLQLAYADAVNEAKNEPD